MHALETIVLIQHPSAEQRKGREESRRVGMDLYGIAGDDEGYGFAVVSQSPALVRKQG